MSFLLLPWPPKVSPSCQNGFQGAKVEAPGLPNDRFGTPRIAISMTKVTSINKHAKKTNLQKPNCLHTLHRNKPRNSKHAETNKLSKAAELTKHSHHHTAIFLRVGAGGMGA